MEVSFKPAMPGWLRPMRKWLIGLVPGMFFLFAATSAVAEQGRIYKIGVVPQFETRRLQAIWRPILKELEKRTGLHFTLRGAPSIQVFEKEFMAGNFDFAYMNPYHVLRAQKEQGYLPLVRDTGRKLYGVLVVRKDSPVREVKALHGQIVAFPAANALGASLLVRAELHDVYHIRIRPRYVKTHDSVYLNVVLGEAAAGGGVQKSLQNQSEEVREALRVLYRTRKVVPHPFAAHPRVPKAVRDKVREALLAMGRTEAGRQLLARIPIKKVGPASMADYRPLGKMGLERFYQRE